MKTVIITLLILRLSVSFLCVCVFYRGGVAIKEQMTLVAISWEGLRTSLGSRMWNKREVIALYGSTDNQESSTDCGVARTVFLLLNMSFVSPLLRG